MSTLNRSVTSFQLSFFEHVTECFKGSDLTLGKRSKMVIFGSFLITSKVNKNWLEPKIKVSNQFKDLKTDDKYDFFIT